MNKVKHRTLFPILLVMLMIGSIFTPLQAHATGGETGTQPILEERVNTSEIQSKEVNDAVKQSIEQATAYYKNIQPKGSNSHSDYWLFAALWGAGENLAEFPWAENAAPWQKDTFWANGKETQTNTSNEDAGIVIGSILLGQDPHKFGERNMVQDLMNKQKENGSFFTIWGEPWAMIALDLVGANYDREKHLKYMLSQQKNGVFGGADSNGWILTALAPYMKERQEVKEAVELAVATLHKGYQETGVIPGQWGVNANSEAAALMGLAAVGEDLTSSKWTKDGVNLVEKFIETYQQEDGSFWWTKDTAGAIGMATEQSLLALATIAKGESIFVQLKAHKETNLDRTTTVKVRVEGIKETLYPQKEIQVKTFNTNATAFDATIQALQEKGIPYQASGTYISEIGNEAHATFAGWDGWQYMVNGDYPSDYAGNYEVKNGDEIVWFYGNVGDIYEGYVEADEVEKLTLRPTISVPAQLTEGQDFDVVVSSTYQIYDSTFQVTDAGMETKVKNADVYFNGEIFKTDEHGIARIPGEKAKVGTYELKVTKDIEGSYPRLLRQAKKVIIEEKPKPIETPKSIITFSVETRTVNSSDIIAPIQVPLNEGDTAYTVLQRVASETGVAVAATGSGATLYVQAINGLAEFDKGTQSGWMYSVNGVFPQVSAGMYTLKNGDILRWQYTRDLGHDIGGGYTPPGGSSGGGGVQPDTSEIEVPADTHFVLDEKFQKNAKQPIIANFGSRKVLPQVTAPRGEALLEISQGTKVMSEWDGKLQLPTFLTPSDLKAEQLNTVLNTLGKEISTVDVRVKVGGPKTIQFDQYVTLTFKGKAGYEAGFIGEDGKFVFITKDPDATDVVYAYANGEDLIIKTKHFTEFILLTTQEKSVQLSDIDKSWAKAFIEKAVQQGFIKGYPDGTFKPNQSLTRAQAASIIVRGLGLTTTQLAPFPDMQGYAKETQDEIAAAYAHGIVIGQQGKFNPAGEVTRAQLALMLHRAYTVKTGTAYQAPKAPYPDFGSYDEETVNAISTLYELKVATGSNGFYKPNDSTSRAQAAKMMVNFFEAVK